MNGNARWSYQLGKTCHSTPAATDYLLVGCDENHLYAFRAK